jgi:hypothetical protein
VTIVLFRFELLGSFCGLFPAFPSVSTIDYSLAVGSTQPFTG